MTSPNILEFLGGNGQDLGGPGSPLGARGWGGRASGILGVFLGSRQTKKEVREKSLLEHIPGVTRLRDIVDRIVPAEFEPFREAAAQILPVIAGGGVGTTIGRAVIGTAGSQIVKRATAIAAQRVIGGRGAAVLQRSLAPAGRLGARAARPAGMIAGGYAGAVFAEPFERSSIMDRALAAPMAPMGRKDEMTMQPFERGMQLPAGNTIVKVWYANGTPFAKLLDGRIAVQKGDGTIKTYRPQKMIVISRNPKIGSLLRGHRRTSRLLNKIAKQSGMTRRKGK